MTVTVLLVALASSLLQGQGADPARRAITASSRPIAAGSLPDALGMQVMLDRAGFSPGVLDGQPGSNTDKAFAAYQSQRGDETATPTIAAGPNHPVGLVWIDISHDHYGRPGTPEPSQIGRSESHGCVCLTNWDLVKLAVMVKPGTRVLFTE